MANLDRPGLLLRVAQVCKSYATAQGMLPVLRGVDLSLAHGESLALMGESGSGKSTLLHLIAGLDRPDSGSIEVFPERAGRAHGDGHPQQADPAGRLLEKQGEAALAHWRRTGIGLVFQQYNLIPSLPVGANLAMQARLARRHDPAWTAELARRLGLAELLTRYPEQLSGGQQQRVAIGRALAARPALVLADEPTGSLDEASSDAVLDLLLGLVEETGAGLLMVTHSARLAQRLSRQVTLHLGRVRSEAA